MKFTSNNYYIKYRLFEHLNSINSSIFTSGYTFLIDFSTGITSGETLYYDKYNATIDNSLYYTTGGDTHGTLVKITPTNSNDVNYFRKNTYLNIISNSGTTKNKTLIVDLVPNEYLIIETYKSNSGLTIEGLETIYKLGEISNILYDVYINDNSPKIGFQDYYRKKYDNMRRDICNAYSKFISEDTNIIKNTTAILMFDDNKKFILKVYDPENMLNGGIVALPIVYTNLSTYSGSTITSKSAKISGEITSDGGSTIIERGICYSSLNINPNLNNDYKIETFGTLGKFNCVLIDLEPSTIYYYSSYAINNGGISYGGVNYFTTLNISISVPTVYSLEKSESENIIIGSSSISGLTSIVADTGWVENFIPPTGITSAVITKRGFYYVTGTTITPNVSNTLDPLNNSGRVLLVDNGLAGTNSFHITSLNSSTWYTFRSYAINDNGIGYGNSIQIETT